MMPRPLTSITELFEDFDAFIIDQFGVLHDGSVAYPGAIDALKRLKRAGKTVVLMSNSGRRARPNCERLTRLGFEAAHYDAMVSSGELAWQLLAEGRFQLPRGARVLLVSRDDDTSAMEGLGFSRVRKGDEADLVLLGGSEGDRLTLDDYRAILSPAAAAGVPCICTNPDKVMLTPVGPRFGAGHIAELYEELGGQVVWIGKPYPEIYALALSRIGNSPARRAIAIGDSIEHDIAGGSVAGLRTALVRSGILADADDAALAALYQTHGAIPDYLLPRFA